MENRYWNGTGLLQAEYNEMEDAGFEHSKAHEQLTYSYYRYYNDGDLPGWARNRWDFTRYSYDFGYAQKVLNESGEEEYERRVTERIEIEYRRFKRTQKSA